MSEWNFDEISWNFLRFEWDCCENFWEEWDLMRFECDDRASLLDSWMGMGFFSVFIGSQWNDKWHAVLLDCFGNQAILRIHVIFGLRKPIIGKHDFPRKEKGLQPELGQFETSGRPIDIGNT